LGVTNVLASFGEPSNEQIDSLYAPSVILGFDNDVSGGRFAKKLSERLQVPSISVLNWGVVGIKDAGDLKDESQFLLVHNARIKILRSQKTKVQRIVKSDRSFSGLQGKNDPSFL
jgi:DNA primase